MWICLDRIYKRTLIHNYKERIKIREQKGWLYCQEQIITRGNCIQLYDRLSNNKVIIDIYTATEIYINELKQIYEIQLDNNQYIKLKIYQ